MDNFRLTEELNMALSRYCRLTWSCSLVNSDCFLTHLLGSVTRDSSSGETKLFRKGPARNSVLCGAPADKRLTFKCKVNVIRKKPTEDSRILNLITITWSRISQWQSEYCLENCQPFDYKFCFIGKIIGELTISENICSICQLCLDFFPDIADIAHEQTLSTSIYSSFWSLFFHISGVCFMWCDIK